jgi:hypothetical protein
MFTRSSINRYSFTLILALVALFQISCLSAETWGTTGNVSRFEKIVWDEVYGDLNGLKFTAWMPGYHEDEIDNEMLLFDGQVVYGEKSYEYYVYFLTTYFLPNKGLPFKEDELINVLQLLHPNHAAKSIKPKKYGAKYVVELTPKSTDGHIENYYRYICTKDRLIKLSTEDENSNRRQRFFDSIKIK